MSTNHLTNHIISVDSLVPGGGTVTDITIASPNSTIDVTNGEITTSGTVEVDINGKPPADKTDLGTTALRWKHIYLRQNDPAGSKVKWVNDANTQVNSINFNLATGPSFSNDTSGNALTFDQSNLTTSRTAGWQNSDGTVAWLTDTTNALSNLYANPSLVTLNHTTGGTFVSGVGLPAVIFVTSDTGVTIAGTTTIDAQAGDLAGGWELVVTFLVASTTVAHSSIFSATNAKTLPTTATAGQTFRYIWDDGASKYKYYQ